MLTSIVISIITGVLLGFATSVRTPTDGLEDLTRNIVVGMAGAFVGLQVAGGVLNSAETGVSSIAQTVAAITGSAILLFIVHKVRRA